MISIIIPVYQEERILREEQFYFQQLSQYAEVIFVDGGSCDQTTAYARRYGRLVIGSKGRAAQMNTGAGFAKGEILLFLHVDTKIAYHSLAKVEDVIKKGYIGGCFQQMIDHPGWIFRWIAWTGNVRARLSKIFYGDQGIFVSREHFQRLGGFPLVRLGEDVLFSQQLRRVGRVIVLAERIHCSARRWQGQGLLQTFILNWRINWALLWGRDMKALSNLYADIREGTS